MTARKRESAKEPTPIMPGSYVVIDAVSWHVGAVGITGGERYYWLTRDNGRTVAMLPAFVVEPQAQVNRLARRSAK